MSSTTPLTAVRAPQFGRKQANPNHNHGNVPLVLVLEKVYADEVVSPMRATIADKAAWKIAIDSGNDWVYHTATRK